MSHHARGKVWPAKPRAQSAITEQRLWQESPKEEARWVDAQWRGIVFALRNSEAHSRQGFWRSLGSLQARSTYRYVGILLQLGFPNSHRGQYKAILICPGDVPCGGCVQSNPPPEEGATGSSRAKICQIAWITCSYQLEFLSVCDL